jgi:hypothetical protein
MSYDQQDSALTLEMTPLNDCIVQRRMVQTLPPNALKGPGDTFDPYWLPQGFVLGDTSDIFLVPTDPVS